MARHPVFGDFPHDGHLSPLWFGIVKAAPLLQPEDEFRNAEPLMVGEGKYGYSIYLSQARVDQGRLLYACGLDVLTDTPERAYLLDAMLDYARSDIFTPQAKVGFGSSPFSTGPKGCLPGFHRLVTNEGEDTVGSSYREDNARVFICRQIKPGNRITWETVPLPKESTGDRITFVFAGGMGYFMQPKTEGFMLEINGNDILRFDLPHPPPPQWESADKRVQLRFEHNRQGQGDQYGLFYVTIARDMLTPGKACQLGVRSLGTGSRRWFVLNPYINTK